METTALYYKNTITVRWFKAYWNGVENTSGKTELMGERVVEKMRSWFRQISEKYFDSFVYKLPWTRCRKKNYLIKFVYTSKKTLMISKNLVMQLLQALKEKVMLHHFI